MATDGPKPTKGSYIAQLLHVFNVNEPKTWRIAIIVTKPEFTVIARKKIKERRIADICDKFDKDSENQDPFSAETSIKYTVEWAKQFQFAEIPKPDEKSDSENIEGDDKNKSDSEKKADEPKRPPVPHLMVDLPSMPNAKAWSIMPILDNNIITQKEVDEYSGKDNIPCIEAVVIAGEKIENYAFLFHQVDVQGSITNLSFNLVLQVLPKAPAKSKEGSDKNDKSGTENLKDKSGTKNDKSGTEDGPSDKSEKKSK